MMHGEFYKLEMTQNPKTKRGNENVHAAPLKEAIKNPKRHKIASGIRGP